MHAMTVSVPAGNVGFDEIPFEDAGIRELSVEETNVVAGGWWQVVAGALLGFGFERAWQSYSQSQSGGGAFGPGDQAPPELRGSILE